MSFNTLVKAARPPFLLLTPVCVFLAYAMAQTTATPNLMDTLYILLGAVAAHLAVNLLNEYQDFQSGLDLHTVKTPFSGGSGALPENPQGVKIVLLTALGAIALVIWVGIHFISTKGSLELIPVGALGLLLIIGYTSYINRLPWVCLFAPGFGFGILMVLGSYMVMSGGLNSSALILALVPFFQINNLLLLNQLPDIDADKQVGRRHFAIAFGVPAVTKAYTLFAVLPFAMIVLMLMNESLPLLGLIALLPLLPTIAVIRGLQHYGQDIAGQHKYLALNVMVTLSTPTLLAIALLFG